MLETPHVVVGAAIATKVSHPALAIPLAFLSHFVLERVPHWNPHLNTELEKFGEISKQSKSIVVIDTMLALTIGSFIASRALPDIVHSVTILASCFMSVLPDVIEGPYFFLKMKTKFIEKWVLFQKSIQADTSPLPGLATQLVTVLTALYWIFT